MLRLRGWLLLVFVGIWLSQGARLFGQALEGDILGTIQDSTGAVVPGAKVTLTQVGTGVSVIQTADTSGNYFFAQLNPGHYRLEVSKEGFKTQTVQDIELLVRQHPRVDVTLELGAVTQRIEVSAGGVQLLETQISSIGQVVQEKPILDLPLNGRNFIQLTQLGPGINPVAGSGVSCSEGSNYTGGGSGKVSVSAMGIREQNVSYLIDGIETRDARWGTVTVRPSPDAIQEFKMETSAFGVENGRSSVVVNLTLKSGSNTLHGTGYEFLRNSSLDAGEFFLNEAGLPKPAFQQNDFGASVGGPIIHDKTFFFGSFEGFRSRKGAGSFNGIYPSRAQLAGNLADDSAGTGIFPTNSPFCTANPGSSKCLDVINPFTGQLFSGNVIPMNMLDPQAQQWIPYTRVPNVAVAPGLPSTPSFNFAFSPKNLNDFNQFHVRVDHAIGAKDRLYGSYSFDDRPHREPGLAIGGGVTFPWRAQVFALNETHLFTPTIVNEFRYGYRKSRTGETPETSFGPNIEGDIFHLKNVSRDPINFGVPSAGIAGFSCIGSFNTPLNDHNYTHQFTDNLSIVRGKHQIKAGFNVIHENFLYLCNCTFIPQFTFDGRFTGSGLGDLLLGIPFETFIGQGEPILDGRANYYAAYLGDDYRVRPDLTLNLGIRYEYNQWPRDVHGREETFDAGIGRVVAVWRGEVRNGIVDPDWRDFAPRIGLAYSPSFLKNTVIRAAAGTFYSTDNYNEYGFVVFGPDLTVDFVQDSDPVHPTLFMRDLLGQYIFGTANPGAGIFGFGRTNKTPYVNEWNLDIQHTFANNWLLELGYAGNRGERIWQRRDDNTPAFDPTGKTSIASRRRYKAFSFILDSDARGWSSYNGAFVKVEKRVSQNSYLLASYTWSHALDLGQDAGPSGGTTASRDYNVYDKGNSAFDTRHRFIASYIYALPIGRDKRFFAGASGPVDKLISGWTLNGITTFASGQYESPNLGRDWANLGPFTKRRPDLIGNPYPPDQNFNNWFNKSAFALPGCPTLTPCPTGIHLPGNIQRNTLQMPGLNNWDLALMKDIKASERYTIQFRAETFNTWNHTQFGTPGNNVRRASFGKITTLRIPPREVQFGLKLLW